MPRSGWRGVTAALKGRYRMILFDPLGSGESDDPQGPLSIASMADDAARLLEFLDIGGALLVGSSMGGFSALEMALRHRAVVRGMVLFCCASRLEGWGRFQIETWRRLRREGVSSESLIRLQLAATLPPDFFDDLRSVEAMVSLFLAHREELAQSDAGFLAQAEASLAFDGEGRLGGIDCPALVVAGGQDRMVPPESVRVLHRSLRGSRFELFPRGGHALAVTEGSAMAKAIDAFISGL